jgi:aldehyde:ferredoxin oxidoreductase
MKNGLTDQILWIDLGTNEVQIKPISSEMKENYLGGRGYGAKLLYDHTDDKTDPFGPENLLIFATGPMTGEARWPGGTKSVVCCLSPATNGYGEASVGGFAGGKLKEAGFDVIVLTGQAEDWSAIVINAITGEISLEPVIEEMDSLKLGEKYLENYGKNLTCAFTIGIGGRNLVRFACINGIHWNGNQFIPRQAGRTGVGAVMGSKKIPAIVIIANKNPSPEVADVESLKDAGKKMRQVVSENDRKQYNLFKFGTSSMVELMNEIQVLPVRNYSTSKVPEAIQLEGMEFTTNIFKRAQPCSPGCNLACGKLAKAILPNGEEVWVDGPEYETISLCGSNLGIFDSNFVTMANYYCDIYGIDTISTGNIIGFAMEMYEKGYITQENTEGIDLVWGNQEAVLKVMEQIVHREGFGNHLADGIVPFMNYIANGDESIRQEIEKCSMHSKGLEVSGYIPRISLAQQVAYGTSLIGAHHREAWLISIDALRNEIPTFDLKSEILIWYQNMRTWVDIVGVCKLHWIDVRNPLSDGPKNLATVENYLQAVNAVIGGNMSLEDHFKVTERVYTLIKLINLRRGLSKKDDHIPERGMGNFSMEEYDRLLEKYYELRGWDENGVPLPETLEKFGLS